jgi:glycosyltransferase involved in cell wall biosynthesis
VVNSEVTGGLFRKLGWTVITMDLGVNTDRFRPISDADRARLRAKLGWDEHSPVVLHVGHLRAGRGLDRLAELAAAGRHRVVMVASLSERGEEDLAADLESSGVEVHHDYIERIERYYQASDLYLFPVKNETSAIDLPLSVLEAMACEKPILTTPHGALPDRLRDAAGVHWLDPRKSIVDQVDSCLGSRALPTGAAHALGWDDVFDQLFLEISEALP